MTPNGIVMQNEIALQNKIALQTNGLQTDTLQSIALRTDELPIYEVRKLSFSYGDTIVLRQFLCSRGGENSGCRGERLR